jgi:predicted nucleic acid-binding protein
MVALLWTNHVHHIVANRWRTGKELVLCPITELGFIRVSTSPAFNATMADARRTLADFIRDEQPDFVPADVRALDGQIAPTSGKTTDFYLANLADKHGLKLATFDGSINHSAVEVVT